MADASTRVRCPKCHSRTLELAEVGEASMAWMVENGRLTRNGGTLELGGLHAVYASCLSCKHHWRVRRAIQITDVIEEDHPHVTP